MLNNKSRYEDSLEELNSFSSLINGSFPLQFQSFVDVLDFQIQEFRQLIKKGEAAIYSLAQGNNTEESIQRGKKRLNTLSKVAKRWNDIEKDADLISKVDSYLCSQGFQYKSGKLSVKRVGWGKDAIVVGTANTCARIYAFSKDYDSLSRTKNPEKFIFPYLEQPEASKLLSGADWKLLIEVFPLFESSAYSPDGAFGVYHFLRDKLNDYQLEFSDIFIPNITQASLWGQQPVVCDPDAVIPIENSSGSVLGELEIPHVDKLIESWFIDNKTFLMDHLEFHDFILKNVGFSEELRVIKRQLPLSEIEKRIALDFAKAQLNIISIASYGYSNIKDSINEMNSWEVAKKFLLNEELR